jgi:ubiquinone/menaquinone biosynthesis C-methylase UbiE
MMVTDWKKEARKQWNKTPCGSVDKVTQGLDYYLAVESYRYNDYAPWMRDFFEYHKYNGKRVLEIGFGQGTDLCQFAIAGAECYGVDITEKHLSLARKNFELRALQAALYKEDASKLHFDDETFDVVYSFGVLHHTPDTIRCFSEAYRVLKTGGKFIVALYNKHSAFYFFCILLVSGLIKGKYKKLGYDGLLSTIEKGADGINIKPLVKLYSPRQLRIMLSDFKSVSIHVKHLHKDHFSIMGRFMPCFLIDLLESRLGWYLIAKAIK